jgi:uncharacterized protein
MKVIKYSGREHSVSSWSGGKTTQLWIYPPESAYANRDFEIRLSSATVEVEESDFTALPGFHRKLMILEGEITIFHEHQYSKNLKILESDSFSGSWKTRSVGQCVDFNVMNCDKYLSEIEGFNLNSGENKRLRFSNDCVFQFVYLHFGDARLLFAEGRELALREGDLIEIKDLEFLEKDEMSFEILADTFCRLITVEIHLS